MITYIPQHIHTSQPTQVLAGYKELVALDGPEWAETKAKGGDEVRRRLGYVGTKSPLFNIQKAFKVPFDNAFAYQNLSINTKREPAAHR